MRNSIRDSLGGPLARTRAGGDDARAGGDDADLAEVPEFAADGDPGLGHEDDDYGTAGGERRYADDAAYPEPEPETGYEGAYDDQREDWGGGEEERGFEEGGREKEWGYEIVEREEEEGYRALQQIEEDHERFPTAGAWVCPCL